MLVLEALAWVFKLAEVIVLLRLFVPSKGLPLLAKMKPEMTSLLGIARRRGTVFNTQ
jgi:hypothetical protein